MIIELTEENGQKVYINSDNIVRFNHESGFTSIKMVDGQWVNVKDNPDYISSKINNWGK
ncbi:flagellar FlbD family protein [Enterobacter hormaechei]|uniref:flagellar FlbD family protein n=1 Tax=Enterobacter hormaechei TaxID=158836 RepID=UPI0009B302E6|nr:flagellar FlbD family protein [Enterobacter hormaechei]